MPANGTSFGPYQIIAPLGAGGMGEVYRAHDPRLRRDVALKLLPAARSADADAVARIVRESRVIAALTHPSILTIYDVGAESGVVYLVTELIEGETLRTRLGRGVPPLRQTVERAAAIAGALAAAHARGVVHRDLKPDNIMVTAADEVKVLDFGVAKVVALPDETTNGGHTQLTEPGGIVGTPAYMAPEQLDGRAVDHRADQFAFGVLLYEMIAGLRPFKGATPAEVSASILRDDPPLLTAQRSDVPAPLARMVARCLAKNPEHRYASTTDLAHALTDLRADFDALTTPPPRREPAADRRRFGAAAAVIAVVLAAGALIVFNGFGRSAAPASPPAVPLSRTIAVLPFTTIGGGDAYLADGLSEAVARELGRVEGARVIASSTTFAYRERQESIPDVGRELGASLVVRGSVQHAGERIRITASLVQPDDGTTVWSEQYTRSARDILAVQDDIAWKVASKLAARLGAGPPPRPAETPMTTAEAYDAYLRGRDLLRAGSASAADAAVQFEQAVAHDPNFALAHAGLASALTQQFFYVTNDPALEKRALIAIGKALAINPDLAEAYLARAQLLWNLRNGFPHERTIADLKRALEDNPNLAEAHVEIGKLYYHIGLLDKAIAANREALRLDPRSPAAANRVVLSTVDAGRREEVADGLARNPQWPIRTRSVALSFLGRSPEAIAVIAPDGVDRDALTRTDPNGVALLASLLARVGRIADAERTLEVAIPYAANPTGLSDTHHAQFDIGRTYALLGQPDKALEWITKAANEGYPSYPRFSTDPDLVSLKSHPGFVALLERLRKDHERWSKTL